MKVIQVSSKVNVKTILMTKPVILNPNDQKTNKRQTIVGFGSKSLKFCIRIKTFLQMLEKEACFAKLSAITLHIVEIHKSIVKKLTLDVLIFNIAIKNVQKQTLS